MKVAALIVTTLAASVTYGGVRLLMATHRFATGDQYRPGVFVSFSHAMTNMDPDGYAIYAPALLMIGAGLYLTRFAYNLWTADRPTSQRRRTGRDR